MNKLFFLISLFFSSLLVVSGQTDLRALTTSPSHGPNDLKAGYRKGVTQGYYLGFRSLADEMRDLRRPSGIPVTTGFLKTLYIDVLFMKQSSWKILRYGQSRLFFLRRSDRKRFVRFDLGLGLGRQPEPASQNSYLDLTL